MCAHLRLAASAATTTETCELMVNGLNLFGDTGCALDRLVVGRDGVCVAALDPPNTPRATCFDTKNSAAGAGQLASWIDGLAEGATVMVVSCSRLAWAHNTGELAVSLAALGAADLPTHIDDAYALLGVKGAAVPLAEARNACCDRDLTPICHICDQIPAVATAYVACGADLSNASSSTVLGQAVYGTFGSDSYVAALSALLQLDQIPIHQASLNYLHWRCSRWSCRHNEPRRYSPIQPV